MYIVLPIFIKLERKVMCLIRHLWRNINVLCLDSLFEILYLMPPLLCNLPLSFVSVQQICHRDLKLENTLLDGSPAPLLKICDFGYSKVCTHSFPFSSLLSFPQSSIQNRLLCSLIKRIFIYPLVS